MTHNAVAPAPKTERVRACGLTRCVAARRVVRQARGAAMRTLRNLAAWAAGRTRVLDSKQLATASKPRLDTQAGFTA